MHSHKQHRLLGAVSYDRAGWVPRSIASPNQIHGRLAAPLEGSMLPTIQEFVKLDIPYFFRMDHHSGMVDTIKHVYPDGCKQDLATVQCIWLVQSVR
eukprot:1970746-Pyramimonas_sp.AAC.1